jgi:hypothetical protein
MKNKKEVLRSDVNVIHVKIKKDSSKKDLLNQLFKALGSTLDTRFNEEVEHHRLMRMLKEANTNRIVFDGINNLSSVS